MAAAPRPLTDTDEYDFVMVASSEDGKRTGFKSPVISFRRMLVFVCQSIQAFDASLWLLNTSPLLFSEIHSSALLHISLEPYITCQKAMNDIFARLNISADQHSVTCKAVQTLFSCRFSENADVVLCHQSCDSLFQTLLPAKRFLREVNDTLEKNPNDRQPPASSLLARFHSFSREDIADFATHLHALVELFSYARRMKKSVSMKVRRRSV